MYMCGVLGEEGNVYVWGVRGEDSEGVRRRGQ